jgi:hypothetical protein
MIRAMTMTTTTTTNFDVLSRKGGRFYMPVRWRSS